MKKQNEKNKQPIKQKQNPIKTKGISIEKIRSYITEPVETVFKNADVFTERYIPERLIFRDDEINQILENVAKAFQDIKPQNMFIWGSPGTGKTTAFEMIMKAFGREANKLGIPIKFIYVDAKYKTLPQAIGATLQQFDRMVNLKGIGFEEMLQKIYPHLEKQITCLIYDDVDKMIKKYPYAEPFDILINTISRLATKNIDAFTCVLANNRKIENELKSFTKSTFAPQRLYFREYNATEMNLIIQDRCEVGFHDGVISKEDIVEFSKYLLSTSNDLRTGLDVLKEAGWHANLKKQKTISSDDLLKSLTKVIKNTLVESITQLSDTQLALLWSIALVQKRKGFAESGHAYNQYKEKILELLGNNSFVCTKRHLTRNVAAQMEVMGLFTSKLKGRGKAGGVALTYSIDMEELDDAFNLCNIEISKRKKTSKIISRISGQTKIVAGGVGDDLEPLRVKKYPPKVVKTVKLQK